MLNERSLAVATDVYYWKPMAAFFRSIEMGLYVDAGIRFEGPVLDMGCGDGGIMHMLRRLGVVAGAAYGMDIEYGELAKAIRREHHAAIYQADGNHLPFPDQTFSSAVCNGVLCSIPGGPDAAISEIYRVLKPGGMLVLTVPTDEFLNVLFIPKVLRMLSRKLAAGYCDRLNSRLPHFTTLSPHEWQARFERSGFALDVRSTFFSPGAGRIWNLLSMQLFRGLGILKLLGSGAIRRVVGGLERGLFRFLYRESPSGGEGAGYVFFVLRKAQ